MTAEALIVQGDALDVLRALPDESIACCVTSPPYWGLRDYGVAGQIGLETTPDEYVARLVAVFTEVHRVLADDGTLWLNLGDSYASQTKGSGGLGGTIARGKGQSTNGGSRYTARSFDLRASGIKPKDLVGIPWRVAFALQAAGWYLRSDIIWAKGFSGDTRAGSCMPESVRDRPTKAHEYVFLLTKSPRYWYDAGAVKETAVTGPHTRQRVSFGAKRGATGNHLRGADTIVCDGTAHIRSVWHFNTRRFKGAHYATMPITLASMCIRAGCKPGGVVLDPFTGAGTTALAALQHGRVFIGAELNPEYAAIARARIAEAQP